jgi:alkylation response protein AidB-like acyl-CoA dehydrogenase
MSETMDAPALIQFLRDYAATRLNSRLADARRCIPPHVILDLGNKGLLGISAPKEYGGAGLGWTERIPVIEQLAAIDLTLTMLVGIHNELGIGPICAFGSQALKDELLPSLATGRILGGLAITEEGAGSNPRALTTSAARSASGDWCLTGDKIWVGNGSWAGVLNVFARQAGGQKSPVSGFSVLTSSKGVEMGPEAMTMGMRGIVQNRIRFREVSVPAQHLLGEESDDFIVAESSFKKARLGISIAANGALKRCLQLMLRYGSSRNISTGSLGAHPLFRSELSEAWHASQTLDRLNELVAKGLDQQLALPDELYFVVKTLAPEYLWSAVDRLVQWLGGRGYIESNEAPQLLRDARLLRIFEGPTETMRAHLGAMCRARRTLFDYLRSVAPHADVVTRVEGACQELWQVPKPANMSVGQYTFARNLAIGEVVADGVAWWLGGLHGTGEQTAEWAHRRFEGSVLRGQRLIVTPPWQDAELTRTLVDRIGDLTQSLPGEDWAVDNLLRAN